MTTKNFSMMVIGEPSAKRKMIIAATAVILGTTTVFGKTNTTVHNDRNMGHNPRTEVVVVNNHDKGMGRMVEHHNMDRFMINHILDGRHIFNHHGECKVCHMDRHEIKKVERELRHNTPMTPRPTGRTSHFGR